MRNIELTHMPFQPNHLDIMVLREHERVAFPPGHIELLARAAAYCHTYLYKGRVLCIAGYVEVWPGVREVFVIPSVYVSYYAVPFHRAVRKTLDGWMKECHRMQTNSLADEVTDRWMVGLGFHVEGVLEKYSYNRLDYKMWARLK